MLCMRQVFFFFFYNALIAILNLDRASGREDKEKPLSQFTVRILGSTQFKVTEVFGRVGQLGNAVTSGE